MHRAHDLTLDIVARACKITPRYVHHLFAERGETAGNYLMRRRLELCAQALSSPTQRHLSVTAIAFDHGFNSQTHFSRVFRAKFGATPRDYRRATLAMD
jgi:AraC-like DNA-binding protein